MENLLTFQTPKASLQAMCLLIVIKENMKTKKNGNKTKNKKSLRNPIRLLEETWDLINKSSEQEFLLQEQRAETEKQHAETEKQFKETDRKIAELAQHIAENNDNLTREVEESNRRTEEVNRASAAKLDKVGELLGNIGRNSGAVAEEFFYNGLSESMRIGDLEFDFIMANVRSRQEKKEGEFDIVLTNSSSVALVEVKYKVHPNDVIELLEKRLPRYKSLFLKKANYKIYVVIAGLSVPDDVRSLAAQYGFIVLTQAGNDMKIIQNEWKTY